jgi:hypothetical protein
MHMASIREKPSEGLSTSSFHVTPETVFTYDGAEPLPSMFTRPQAAGLATEARRSHGKARFSTFIIVLVLLAFAPVQAFLLTLSFQIDREQAIEDALALAKKGAVQAASLLSVPAAEAAVTVRSKSLPSNLAPSFDDGHWFETVDTFKRLLAGKNASQASAAQTENEQLIHNLEAWMNAKASSGSSYR